VLKKSKNRRVFFSRYLAANDALSMQATPFRTQTRPFVLPPPPPPPFFSPDCRPYAFDRYSAIPVAQPHEYEGTHFAWFTLYMYMPWIRTYSTLFKNRRARTAFTRVKPNWQTREALGSVGIDWPSQIGCQGCAYPRTQWGRRESLPTAATPRYDSACVNAVLARLFLNSVYIFKVTVFTKQANYE